MTKKQYIFPLTEVVTVNGTYNVMRTSVELLSDPAPGRRENPEVF